MFSAKNSYVCLLLAVLSQAGCMQTTERTTKSIITIDPNLTYNQTRRKNELRARKAIRENPDDPAPHYFLARSYLMEGDLQKAREEFETIIRLSPESAGAHYELGLIHARTGNYDDAIKAVEKAVSIMPDFARAYYTLARLYEKTGDYEKAEIYDEAYRERTKEDAGHDR